MPIPAKDAISMRKGSANDAKLSGVDIEQNRSATHRERARRFPLPGRLQGVSPPSWLRRYLFHLRISAAA